MSIESSKDTIEKKPDTRASRRAARNHQWAVAMIHELTRKKWWNGMPLHEVRIFLDAISGRNLSPTEMQAASVMRSVIAWGYARKERTHADGRSCVVYFSDEPPTGSEFADGWVPPALAGLRGGPVKMRDTVGAVEEE